MKSKQKILLDHLVELSAHFEDHIPEIMDAMDEHADQYAKAAISHTLKQLVNTSFLNPSFSESDAFFLQSFKESKDFGCPG